MEEDWVEYDGGAVQEWHRNASRIRVAPGVAVIPERAFQECFGLRAVDLSNVTTISNSAFRFCHSLERVIWTTASAVEIGKRAFATCSSLREIDMRNVNKCGEEAFAGCRVLERVAIPSSVADIGAGAFRECENLVVVELSEGIQRIGNGAFSACSALVRINIPASVTDIGLRAFSVCRGLAGVELNEGLQRIESKAFQHCGSLAGITIPSTALKVGNHAFSCCCQLRSVELQEGLQTIGWGAFDGCHSLERITIPSSTTIVGGSAFQDCRSLTEVTLREGFYRIYSDSEAFRGCTSLAHVNIPPVAFVIDVESRSSCQLLRETMPVPVGRTIKLVVSKWLQYRSPVQLELAEAKVNEILARRPQPVRQKIALIREWFAYYERLDVTTMLELAIWGCNMNGNEQEQGAEARQERRRNCGSDMNVIIPGVLPFLEASSILS